MNARKPLIALFTLTTTLTTGLTIALQPTQAQVLQGRFSTPSSGSVHHAGNFSTLASAVGSWKGGMHSKGDDAVTTLQVQIQSSASGYQGNWQVLGEAGILQQGKLSGTQQGNTVTLKLEKYNGNTSLVLNGTIKSGGKSVTGQVGNSNFVGIVN